ncbi:C-type lectin domain family 4 member E-like [Branchiostoma lanceolatum]|uniref:C-type lectin domain family 4 member E-like n=1 Tax=Branchiostoma lanceolatum TaxID=7740 RepID=UPI00345500FD
MLFDLTEIHGLKIKTSAAADSQSDDPVTIEIFSADCEDVCTAVTVSGLARAGTEYNRTFAASNFGVPTRLRLTASGEDWLKLDWVDVYNAHTERSHHFSCPSGGCQLSADTSEGSEQIELDVDVCPSGYVPFQDGERCFKFSAGKRNYTEARSACQAAGGHLALPKDQATNDFLVNQINDWYPPGFSVWFGLTDQVEEGTFVWEDGTPLGNGWSNWSPEQPDDYQSVEDCAEWKHEYGYKWNDFPCTTSRYYVCELGSAAP